MGTSCPIEKPQSSARSVTSQNAPTYCPAHYLNNKRQCRASGLVPDVITDSFFEGIGGIEGGSRVGTYGNVLTEERPDVYVSTLDATVFPDRNSAEAEFTIDGDDLLITITDGSGDSLRIVDPFALSGESASVGGTIFVPGYYAAIEKFVFADTTTDAAALLAT